ncbi:MAG: poly-gamma-glutamate system protein [Deltaproteobacteria bacterium]|jgi:poly-gamma-glutamate system protein|nr:poly-gamma-glutamate system protein [Deltaproteobacteria bacterium]MBW2534804.1 poly-gamma-glutamate system protein [Deltaproteobacteria bacterium]
MKALYWRPQRISLKAVFVVTFVAFCGFAAVETFRVEERQPYHGQKMRAARTALEAFRVLKEARLARGLAVDVETDPSSSGLVGELISPVTTNTGHLPSKQTSINPNFAAVVVEMLRKAGVREGDSVAVGMSGSFPALNVCVLSALHTLRLRPLVISSAGSSQWGANHPDFTWLDMEVALAEHGVLPYRSLAVSPGGIDDRVLGLSRRGRELIDQALERSGLPAVRPKSYADSLDQRMAAYDEHGAEGEIRAYVNVGGGTTSVGTRVGKQLFKPGLNTSMPRGPLIDSVMARFASRGVPVIHLTKIDDLAARHGLPLQPPATPAVGEGTIFVRASYSRWLVAAVLLLLVVTLVAVLRHDLGHRLLTASRREASPTRATPEPMV